MSVAWTTSQTLDAPGHGHARDDSYRGRLYRSRWAVLCRRVTALAKRRTEAVLPASLAGRPNPARGVR
jgi:hypothetical protein